MSDEKPTLSETTASLKATTESMLGVVMRLAAVRDALIGACPPPGPWAAPPREGGMVAMLEWSAGSLERDEEMIEYIVAQLEERIV